MTANAVTAIQNSVTDVQDAMSRLHARNHTILGAMMIYLHANTTTPAERAAVLNHALDAVFNLAMMVCEKEDRETLKQELARRILSLDTHVFPPRQMIVETQALNGLFREGLLNMSNDETLMNLLGAMMLAKSKPAVNDNLH